MMVEKKWQYLCLKYFFKYVMGLIRDDWLGNNLNKKCLLAIS
jgi:hypothetical protein